MNTTKLGRLVAASIAVYVTVLPAGAQQARQQADAAPQPPQLQPLDEGETPEAAVPAPQRPRSVVTEKRAYGGRVTEIEVQSGRSRYYLQPNAQGGSSMPDMDSNRIRAPQWRIGEFDLRRGDDAKRASEAAATTPPPPAAPVPAAPGK